MRKSELVHQISITQQSLSEADVVLCVDHILTYLTHALSEKKRIEIRGFGNLQARYQAPRAGLNPKTHEKISVPGKYKVHFRMGKALKDQLNEQSQD